MYKKVITKIYKNVKEAVWDECDPRTRCIGCPLYGILPGEEACMVKPYEVIYAHENEIVNALRLEHLGE